MKEGEKSTWGREIEREKEEHQECHHENSFVSYNIICNCNCYMNIQRNSLLVFPIVEYLFLVVYLYVSCVNCYHLVPRWVPRGLNFVYLQYELIRKIPKSFL